MVRSNQASSRQFRRLTLLKIFFLTLFLSRAANAGELWFAPGDDLNVQGLVAHPDFQELFRQDAPWQNGISHIDVLQLRSPWFLRMPEADIQPVIAFSMQHHIGLAVPLDSVASDTCGRNIEGITSMRGMEFYPRELQRRNVPLRYVVLDEPLYYGHEFVKSNACNYPIPEVARRVAASIRIFRRYYPTIRVVIAEPVQSLSGGVAELAQFLDSYRNELGEYPTAYRLDIQWQKNWESGMPALTQMLQQRRIELSVIFNATSGGFAPSDAFWVKSAEANAETFWTKIRRPPGQVVIQTWDKRPTRILPESDPTTMSGYLNWYINTVGRAAR